MNTDACTDLDAHVRLPRVSGLRLSPGGRRLVLSVETADAAKTRYVKALWEIDPAGTRVARQLTRSPEGESFAGFTPSGDLLFASRRQGAQAAALWLLPAAGGDPRVLVAPPGGVHGVVVSDTGRVVYGATRMPSAEDAEADQDLRKRREDTGVRAILHDEFPIRFWDHDLGPDRTRLFVLDPGGEPRDLTGHAGRALGDECTWEISPDGRTVVATWTVAEPGGSQRRTLVAIDAETGDRRTLADDEDHEYDLPRISPDGASVAVRITRRITPEGPGEIRYAVVPLRGGKPHVLGTGWDRRPHSARWTPDGTALLVDADHHGRCPLFRIDVETGEVTDFGPQDATYTDFHVAPDGETVYALRAAIDSPPAPVRLTHSGVTPLPGPAEALGQVFRPPGRLEEVTATGEDGTPIRAWLALPADPAPAPLVVQVHGGPVMSAKTWSWGANPWPRVARGYAVLQPDFALSTGYGIDFVRRGWNAWGEAPYTDILRLTDAAQARPDIDGTRAAAIGASAGGYLVNWMAGHTDRFAAFVSHASIWTLAGQTGASDLAHFFAREMTPESAWEYSPHRFAEAITTPILITHGALDYRCPISEALQMWWDLSSRAKARGLHRFLHFPDENHFITSPGNLELWIGTVLAFFDQHVLGKPWQPPNLLG